MNLKQKIEEKLKSADVKYRFIPLQEDLPMDIASHVAFHKIKMENAMATMVYETEKGLIGAIKRADTQIDERKLKQIVGVQTLKFAGKENLASLGVEVGLVPYVGLEIPYFLDKKVLEIEDAYGTGGSKILGMAMKAKDMQKANKATVGDFAMVEKSKEMFKGGGYRLLSGITPSGDGSLHIGNYLGAVRQFIELANPPAGGTECFLMVADLHALTTIQDKKTLIHNTETLILNELALLLGMNSPSTSSGQKMSQEIVFFRQSDVPMHTELQSILNNVTPLGLLKRAHAYKDKLQKDVMEDDINVGLFSYPMLMAADILLYKPDLVPVGKDQKQHVEITRDIAGRFNKIYGRRVRAQEHKSRSGGVFKLPEAYIPEEVATVVGTDGTRKMSKSLGNIISIFESEEVIHKQVMGTYTDPTRVHATDPGHTEGNAVFAYLENFGKVGEVGELRERYIKGKVSDVEVKEYLFQSLMKTFGPARAKYQELKENPKIVREILEAGAAKARAVASTTMTEVRDAMGLTNQYSFFDYNSSKLSFRAPQSLALNNTITIDEFARVEVRVGKVTEASNKEGSDKLIRLVVDFGVEKIGEIGEMREIGGETHYTRIIFTGVRLFGYTPADFADKQFFFITNLVPRKMLDEFSQGMILAVDGPDKKPIFISAEGMSPGAKIR